MYQRVPSSQVPICPFRHFCCTMYRLVTKRTRKNTCRRKREREFLRQIIRRALVVLRSVIHWLRELCSSRLSGLSLGAFMVCSSTCNRNRFDSFTVYRIRGVLQYDRLS